MEGKHTPGPYFFRHSAQMISDFEVVSGEPTTPKNVLAVLPSGWRYKGIESFDERVANARLISAAPELLEACEKALAAILEETDCGQSSERECPLCSAKDALRAAIAKARSEG